MSEEQTPDGVPAGFDAAPTSDELCTILTRELRTPLTTVEAYLDLLVNGAVGALSEEQVEFLNVVCRNVQRLSTVVNDWLDISRLEAGRLVIGSQPVDLEEVVDRAIATLRPSIRAKQQQVKVVTAGEPVIATGDPRALLQAVNNLLSNAHKYTPAGGWISLVLAVESDGGLVRLDVVDSGIGLKDEDRERVFRKFFRAHLTEAEPGTGLGLTLTRALVERMGGRVGVTSALGKGSTFTIQLPRAVSDTPETPSPSPADAAPGQPSPPSVEPRDPHGPPPPSPFRERGSPGVTA